ncbi:hypothetical protein [Chryseobacterium populi]|uniref:Uncharacterized protein n=1 Tax=Chryseobacterium populi TaxID=1144316 RepID=J2KGA8_9FLAO|nr:hypothetical protein [Chryseobacterium populi]EJL72163.1 hypothetical protein PMI13_02001 [Chryseobacterium populi]
MKFRGIITLLFFLNFTALPSIAVVFGWDILRTNVIVNEEEGSHSSPTSFIVYEKMLPKTLEVFDYVKFFGPDFKGRSFVLIDDSFHLSPLLTLFYPPPEGNF